MNNTEVKLPDMSLPECGGVVPNVWYHGTRTHEETIKEQGLRYPTEDEFLRWIRAGLDVVGLDYTTWSLRQTGCIRHNLKPPNTFHEMRADYRRKVWATSSYENARNYAQRSPELVWLAVSVEWVWRYPRRKYVNRQANGAADRAVSAVFGPPLVVHIDGGAFPQYQALLGHAGAINVPLGPQVPPSAIMQVDRT